MSLVHIYHHTPYQVKPIFIDRSGRAPALRGRHQARRLGGRWLPSHRRRRTPRRDHHRRTPRRQGLLQHAGTDGPGVLRRRRQAVVQNRRHRPGEEPSYVFTTPGE